jgi:hypothetical protein
MAAIADSSNGTQRYYEVRGAKLYTQIYGHGPPIVFLHGGLAFFDNSFAKQRVRIWPCVTRLYKSMACRTHRELQLTSVSAETCADVQSLAPPMANHTALPR